MIWWFYRRLKEYKRAPSPQQASLLRGQFDRIFKRRTGYAMLDRLLKRLLGRKDELLRVLERPEIPLNTNASENDIRAFVTKRKISGGTVSEKGRQARDVMPLSLLVFLLFARGWSVRGFVRRSRLRLGAARVRRFRAGGGTGCSARFMLGSRFSTMRRPIRPRGERFGGWRGGARARDGQALRQDRPLTVERDFLARGQGVSAPIDERWSNGLATTCRCAAMRAVELDALGGLPLRLSPGRTIWP